MISVIMIGIDYWADTTYPFIKSVKVHEPDAEIVVVDNHSQKPYPAGDYILLRFNERKSYSEAANRAVELSSGEWLIICNNDVLCYAPFAHILVGLEQKAIYGPEIRFKERGWHGIEKSFRYPMGSTICIHRTTFMNCGKFDENFVFAAVEDLEIGWRCEKMGIPVVDLALPFTHIPLHRRKGDPQCKLFEERNLEYFLKKINGSK